MSHFEQKKFVNIVVDELKKNHNFNNFHLIVSGKINDLDFEDSKFLYEITQGSPGDAISIYDNEIMNILDITINCLNKDELNDNSINLSNLLSKLDNDKFKNYLSILKSILILINKLRNDKIDANANLPRKLRELKNISNNISFDKVINKLEFLSKNEKDLFTYSLDKKTFMLNFLTT